MADTSVKKSLWWLAVLLQLAVGWFLISWFYAALAASPVVGPVNWVGGFELLVDELLGR